MDIDRRHRLEIAILKRQLSRAKRHVRIAESAARERKMIVNDIREDVAHFCQEWLECVKLLKGNWQSRNLTKKLWFEYCLEILPVSEEDLLAKMKNSRLFENGSLPTIKNPGK